jgi:hypothetical protein
MVEQEGLQIPSARELNDEIERNVEEGNAEQSAAAADLLQILITFELEPGWCEIKHPFRIYGLQAAAFRLDVPFTGHPMIGHDIIYEHPMNHVASIGRCAEHDFLSFAHAVSQIEDGVYLSIGSAVMSPMIFEKSMAMAQNLAHQKNTAIKNHFMLVVDLHASNWDWAQGEPPEEHPAYYQRFNKTFSRMGGHHRLTVTQFIPNGMNFPRPSFPLRNQTISPFLSIVYKLATCPLFDSRAHPLVTYATE